MKLMRFFFFSLVALILLLVQAGNAQWSIRPIIVTYDTLPRTLESSNPSGMQNIIVVGDEIYFKDDHGIFIAKGDSIIPIVTEMDTIPGTDERFDSFDDYGGLPKPGMWTWALRLVRTGSGGFNILGPRKVAFTYAVNGKLTFFVARPGEIRRFGSLPDAVVFNDTEYLIGEADGVSWWLMEESSSGAKLYVLWNKYVRGFVGGDRYSAFFSFDGETVTKLLAKGDTLGNGDSLRIRSVYGEFKGTLVARNHERDQWMVQALYDVKSLETGQWTVGNGILLLDHGRVTSVVQQGDPIMDLPGGRLPNYLEGLAHDSNGDPVHSVWWQANFNKSAAVLLSDYKTTEWSQGFFLAQGGLVKRLATWKSGDELPGTSGGRIDRFSVLRRKGAQSPTAFVQHIVTLDTQMVASLVRVGHSDADIEEGIFRWEGGTIRKFVVQGDSIVHGKAHVVSEIDKFEYLGSPDELVFMASVDNGDRNQALLLWSGGRVTEIASTVGGGVIDKRCPGKERAVNFISIKHFEVISGGRVVFYAGNPALMGWFLAERVK